MIRVGEAVLRGFYRLTYEKVIVQGADGVYNYSCNKKVIMEKKKLNIEMYFSTLKKHSRESLLTFLYIGLSFLFSGTAFLTWYHRLGGILKGANTGLFFAFAAYASQCLGMAAYGIILRRFPEIGKRRVFSGGILILEIMFTALLFIAKGPGTMVPAGMLLNFSIGLNAGSYLTVLSVNVSKEIRGTIFGLGSGFGSVGSWIISSMGTNNFLLNERVLIIYSVINTLNLIVVILLGNLKEYEGSTSKNASKKEEGGRKKYRSVVFAAAVILLFGVINELSSFYPLANVPDQSNVLEFSRAFYAISLVIAGVVNDLNRKFGRMICIVLLVVPFIMLALRDYYNNAFVILLVNYLVTGFYSVFRAVCFTDYATDNKELYFLAMGGLFFGRLGEGAGFGIAPFVRDNMLLLIIVNAALYGLIILSSMLWVYSDNAGTKSDVSNDRAEDASEEDEELRLKAFAEKYCFSPREVEVLEQILEGSSNGEISEKLFISGNTVKFHMKNILKKTECSNRTELISLVSGRSWQD